MKFKRKACFCGVVGAHGAGDGLKRRAMAVNLSVKRRVEPRRGDLRTGCDAAAVAREESGGSEDRAHAVYFWLRKSGGGKPDAIRAQGQHGAWRGGVARRRKIGEGKSAVGIEDYAHAVFYHQLVKIKSRMTGIVFHIGLSNLVGLENMLRAAGAKAPTAIRRAVNHTGDKARTAMVGALAAQTGMKKSVMKRALKPLKAHAGGPAGFVVGRGSLDYQIIAKGGDVALKYFKPKEKGFGVLAYPWGKTHFYPGGFTNSGVIWRRRRLIKNLHGHAVRNVEGGKWSGKMKIVNSGVFIAEEMIKDASAKAFFDVAQRDLAARLEHELEWVMGHGPAGPS